VQHGDARHGGVIRSGFGRTPDGAHVDAFTLTNANGIEVRTISYGAIITSIRVPDRHGIFADVVLGFDTLEPYLARHPYFGAVVGRYANRIGGARFAVDGRRYELAANDGANHLHGGVRGFDRYVWHAEAAATATGVVFTRTSPDGEEGYPGNLTVRVAYTLTDSNTLILDYDAAADAATPVNLTQHSYFNLAGHDAGDILDHQLSISADRYTPIAATLIPTGELALVDGTPLDFREPATIGARIEAGGEQLTFGRGYDHNWVINRTGSSLATTAVLFDPRSGRRLEVRTTEPGVQFYSGNFLEGTDRGKGGVVYQHRGGLCLETQHFPDSPNKPQFPSTMLRPGRTYRSSTEWRFSVSHADSPSAALPPSREALRRTRRSLGGGG
jgi:aldose 1-epimerase